MPVSKTMDVVHSMNDEELVIANLLIGYGQRSVFV